MIGPFALMDEESQEYLINFHKVREAFRRGEIPSEDVMDFLYTHRREDLLTKAYGAEVQHNEKNLEWMINNVMPHLTGGRRGKSKIVETQDGPVQAWSFEDIESNILYVFGRVKEKDKFLEKSIPTILSQSETGFYDIKGWRIIVESPLATEFRKQKSRERTFEDLSDFEKGRFNQTFDNKDFSQLSKREKERFYRDFVPDYKDLKNEDKEGYRRRFEKQHRKICREVAEEIATMPHFDTIPIRPHYMLIKKSEVRIQTQSILDENNKKYLEFDYILKSDIDSDMDLFSEIRRIAVRDQLGLEAPWEIYENHRGQVSALVNLGDIVLNFHDYDGSKDELIRQVVKKINGEYEKIMQEKGIGDYKFEELDIDERNSKILEALRIGLEDVPLGFFIYSETKTKDIEEKYPEMRFNDQKTSKVFLRDRIHPYETKDGFQHIKGYVCDDAEIIQNCGEFQIRDPIMDEFAEFGEGAKIQVIGGEQVDVYKDKKEERREKKTRKSQRVERLNEKFKLAFFKEGEAADTAFSEIYADFYSRQINGLVGDMIKISPVMQKKEFEDIAFRIEHALFMATDRVHPDNIPIVVEAVNSSYERYRKTRGISAVTYTGSLFAVNGMVRDLQKKFKYLDFRYFEDRVSLEKDLHEHHIELLYQVYGQLANSKKPDEIATSMILSRLMRDYKRLYGEYLPRNVLESYAKKLKGFNQDKKWKMYKVRGREIGMHPVNRKSRIEKSLTLSSVLDVLRDYKKLPFDNHSLAQVERTYNHYFGKK